ncbi:MAG: LysM peptidoglycan-binding domain-containing protein [Candidatus Omnitrophota bacterium]
MKSILRILFFVLLGVAVSGCVTVRKVVRDRVDQDLEGNQGFVKGEESKSDKIAEASRPKTREFIDIQVELPTWQEVKTVIEKDTHYIGQIANTEAKDKYTKQKKFFAQKKPLNDNVIPVAADLQRPNMKVVLQDEAAASVLPTNMVVVEEEVVVDAQPAEVSLTKKPEVKEPPKPTTYKIKDGDSLTKIAYELYGKAYKWPIIYDANAERIKNPDRLKVGMVLTIPIVEEEEFLRLN